MKYIIQLNDTSNSNNDIDKDNDDIFIKQSYIKELCDYLERHKISYKYSPTVKGFIINCMPTEFDKLVISNKKIIKSSVIDTKIVLHQKERASLNKNKIPAANNKQQWSIGATSVDLLWKKDIKGQNTMIAIFDTGVNSNHQQLKYNYSGITYDFTNETNNKNNKSYDDNGHGTFICGIVCGMNINDVMIGIAPKASWMSYKILDRNGDGYLTSFIEACDKLIINNIHPDVINCSFDLVTDNGSYYETIISSIITVLESQNIFVCFSEGNMSSNIENIFSVGSFDINNNVIINNLSKTEIVAPGVNIISCIPDEYPIQEQDIILYDNNKQKYSIFSSSSFASAHVCGTIALIIQCLKKNKIEYNVELIKDIITQKIFNLSHPDNDDEYEHDSIIDNNVNEEIYYQKFGKYGIYITGTLNKLRKDKKSVSINDKYKDHTIRGIINPLRPLPKLNKTIIDTYNPRYIYLNLFAINYYFT